MDSMATSSAARRKLNTWRSKVCTVHIHVQEAGGISLVNTSHFRNFSKEKCRDETLSLTSACSTNQIQTSFLILAAMTKRQS